MQHVRPIGTVPCLTTEQMIEVDRAMVEDYRIELVQMMENAGRNLAHLARVRFLGGDPLAMSVVVLAGTGGNGGGAMVCARRLRNWGATVQVFVSGSDRNLAPVPAHQLDILRRIGVPVQPAESLLPEAEPALVIDGIIGYTLRGSPRGNAARLIEWANGCRAPVLSLDVPSGVDSATGAVFEPAVRASATMTLALPKTGLVASQAKQHVGELYLADISVPPDLYRQYLGIDVPVLFADSEVVSLR